MTPPTDPPAAVAATAETQPGLRAFQTRFLFPFLFDQSAFETLGDALRSWRAPGASDALWRPGSPSRLYRDEYLAHVVDFLFGAGEHSGGYFAADPAEAGRWFQGTRLTLPGGTCLKVQLAPPKVELFLSPFGAGVLSIALAPVEEPLAFPDALDFDYRLGQFRRHSIGKLRRPHPRDDAAIWEKLSPADRDRAGEPSAADAPLTERLVARGGEFDLSELVDFLLAPLEALEIKRVQEELSVYAVARFQPDGDFGDPALRECVAPFLSKLAQVEESTHTGPPAGEVPVSNALLNRLHWAAAGSLGVAHLVGDQKDLPFDDQKVPIVRDKYFVAYLFALQQRLVLHRAIDEASALASPVEPADQAQRLARLRSRLLRFAVKGRFQQVSWRHAVQRFYEVAEAGLGVDRAWAEVRNAIADLDANAAGRRQEQLASRAEEHLKSIRGVQRFLHLIEYVVVSVYFAHLWHMFADHVFSARYAWIQPAGVIFFALVGLLVAWLFDRAIRDKDHGRRP